MEDNEFHKFSSWKKILTVITGYTALISTFVGINTTYTILEQNGFSTLNSILILVGGFLLTFIIVWITGTFIVKFHKGKGEYGLLLTLKKTLNYSLKPKEEKTNNLLDNSTNEIASYWEERGAAIDEIKKKLKETNDNIFISAIGFGTIREVLIDNDVVNKLVDKILPDRSTFKITIVFPTSYEKIRPEVANINANVSKGQEFLRTFRTTLDQVCKCKMSSNRYESFNVDKIIEFKTYNENIMPRHFILHSGNVLFVGSYLCNAEGRNSYLLKLLDKKVPQGIFQLFKKEESYILENSKITLITK